MAAPILTVPASSRRLNPFLLPAATTSQFLLLIILTLSTGALSSAHVAAALTDTGYRDRLLVCADQAWVGAVTIPPDELTVAFNDCVAAAGVALGRVAVLGALLTLAIVVAGHLVRARRQLRGRVPVPLTATTYPQSAEVVRVLAREFHVPLTEHTVVVDSISGGAFGQAMGYAGRYRISVSGSMVRAAERGDAKTLRAVVRHELAHLYNRDVDLTGLTVVAGRVLPLIAALPLLQALPGGDLGAIAQRAGLLAVLLVAIVLVRAAVLRSREHYADVRASLVAHSDPEFLAEAFPDARRAGTGLRARRPAAVDRLFRFHPPTARRARVVAEPGLLLRAGAGEALATGITAALVLVNLQIVGGVALNPPGAGAVLVTAVVGALLATVVGTALWRDTLRALAGGEALPTGVVPALGLSAGFLIGLGLSNSDHLPTMLAADPGLALLALAVFTGGALLAARWTVVATAAWLPVAGPGALRPVLRGGQVALTLAVAAGLTSWFGLVHRIDRGLRWGELPAAAFGVATFAVTVPLLVSAAIFPFCAAVRAARPAANQLLDIDPARAGELNRVAMRPVVVIAAAAGAATIVFAAGFFATSTYVDLAGASAQAVFGRAGQAETGYAFGGLAALSVVAAVVVAGVGAGRASGSGLLHALATGALGIAAVNVVLVALTMREACAAADDSMCTLDMAWLFHRTNVLALFGWVVLLAPGPLCLVAVLRAAWRRAHRPPLDQQGPARPLWSVTGAWLIVSVVVVVVVVPASSFAADLVRNLFPDQVVAQVRGAPVDIAAPRAGEISVADACAALAAVARGQGPGEGLAAWREVALAQLGTDDPALHAFARQQLDGRFSSFVTGGLAAAAYCEVRRAPVAR